MLVLILVHIINIEYRERCGLNLKEDLDIATGRQRNAGANNYIIDITDLSPLRLVMEKHTHNLQVDLFITCLTVIRAYLTFQNKLFVCLYI